MPKPTVHNPTNFDPSHYEVENYLDNKRPVFFGQDVKAYEHEVKWWETEMASTLGTDWRAKAFHCVHCGNGTVRWITAVRHLPTNEVVVFGCDCTKRLGFADRFEFKLAQLQAKAEANKVRIGVWKARQAFLEANPVFATAISHLAEPVHDKNLFAKDVVSKLNQYGSLSEKQMAAVIASLARDVEYAAKPKAIEVKGNAPTGRTEVKGEVLSTKIQSGQWGDTLKMLVKLENNSRVWVSVPSGSGVGRGDRIVVKATWEPSKDDKSFGFGSRPTLISRESAAAHV